MKYICRKFIWATLLTISAFLAYTQAHGCTSAIVSAEVSASGRPLLWKNRDTSTIDNKIAYVPASLPGELPFTALFNANDRELSQAWVGMNSAGFAIMNTASYNLNSDNIPAKDMDKEGVLMALALKHCQTVEDFDKLLRELPKPLGVEANFGVIDATGAGAYFETGNFNFKRFDLHDSPSGVLVRTNYSHSGRPNEGFGQIREKNALHLLAPYICERSITPITFLSTLGCSYYHSLLGKDMLQNTDAWIIDQDFIPRYTTTAGIVIEGVAPMDEPLPGTGESYVMWTALGYPPCAELYPVTCTPSGVHPDLQGTQENGTSAACNRAKARKAQVFSAPDGNRSHYIKIDALKNTAGTGLLQVLGKQNLLIYEKFHTSQGAAGR